MARAGRIGVLVLAVLVIVASWGLWSGSCVDAPAGEGAGCTTQPMLGWPGAVVVTAVALVAMVWAVVGLVRPRRSRGPR